MSRRIPPASYAVPREGTTSRRTTVNPFGTPRLQKWRIPEGGNATGLLAAQLQHELARRFRGFINQSEEGSIAEFSRRHVGISYERLRAVLTGDMWMRLEDIALLADRMGLQMTMLSETPNEG